MLDDFKPSKRIAKGADNTNTTKETFRTPDEVAAEQDLEATASELNPSDLPGDTTQKSDKGWLDKLKEHWPPTRKEWIIIAVALLVIIGGAVFLLTHHSKPTAKQPAKPNPKPAAAKPLTVPSTLTGLQVDPSVNKRVVVGVMIENSVDARPQSGLGQAGVVFEAIAEGGITRFLAVFQDTQPDNIGPIRSARPYYVQWALGFDAAYAHVGGSPEALSNIKEWGVRDLDQFANGGSYHRVSTREAPHNVYTGVPTLAELANGKGFSTSKYTGFVRKIKEVPAKTPTARTVDIAISGPTYNVHYDYDKASNSYHRSEGGAAHMDANTNTQISPKVVIALEMSYGLEADDHHSQYGTIGSGRARIFQDGTSIDGTWTKSSAASQFTFTDGAGKAIQLNPGQTWITAVANMASVTSAP